MVFRDDVLRANLVLAWIGAAAITAPEGLMTSLAGHLQGGPRLTGALLAATPCGTCIGVVLYVRLTPPARRRRLIRPMALLSCVALVPLGAGLPPLSVLALLALAGYGAAYVVVLNTLFVQMVPASHRARAFGVAASGIMASQGAATVAAVALADVLGDPAMVVSLCGLAGAVAMLPTLLRWPGAVRAAPPAPSRPGLPDAAGGRDWAP